MQQPKKRSDTTTTTTTTTSSTETTHADNTQILTHANNPDMRKKCKHRPKLTIPSSNQNFKAAILKAGKQDKPVTATVEELDAQSGPAQAETQTKDKRRATGSSSSPWLPLPFPSVPFPSTYPNFCFSGRPICPCSGKSLASIRR